MAHAENQIKVGDGNILLYQRDDVESLIWQIRIKLPNQKNYIRRSTGVTDFEKAKEKAFQIYGEIIQRDRQNLPFGRKTFAEIAKSYAKDAETRMKEGRNSEGRHKVIEGTLRRYLNPFFGKKDISLINKKDFIDYRAWRQIYWSAGPGKDDPTRPQKSLRPKRGAKQPTTTVKKPPSQATLKQEWTVLRGVMVHGMDIGAVSTNMLSALKHEKTKVNRRPAFIGDEYSRLYKFMRSWVKQDPHPRIRQSRELLREYILIMANSGMRKGEARMLKWRDVIPYRKHGLEWLSLRVNGKTGIRTVICQPNTNRYFDRLKSRGFHTEPDDLVFCHADGLPVDDFTGFQNALVKAGVLHDSDGNRHTIYSLRHTYATYRIENGTNIYWLAKNMGTSVNMIERHYGQTTVFQGIEYETAIRPKKAKFAQNDKSQNANDVNDATSPSLELTLIFDEGPDDLVPFNAVDHTSAIDDEE